MLFYQQIIGKQMPDFFIPGMPDSDEAEQFYGNLLEELGALAQAEDDPRLYRVGFHHERQLCVAQVGRQVQLDPDAGVVLAITESRGLVMVHASTRLGHDAICLPAVKVTGREYFDDFPARSADPS